MGWFFSNSTLFCVIQPLPSCRCFTSGRWSYTGWTFCPLQFISLKTAWIGRRKAEEAPLYSFCFAKLSATYPIASRLVAREKLRTMVSFRCKGTAFMIKWEYLIDREGIFDTLYRGNFEDIVEMSIFAKLLRNSKMDTSFILILRYSLPFFFKTLIRFIRWILPILFSKR